MTFFPPPSKRNPICDTWEQTETSPPNHSTKSPQSFMLFNKSGNDRPSPDLLSYQSTYSPFRSSLTRQTILQKVFNANNLCSPSLSDKRNSGLGEPFHSSVYHTNVSSRGEYYLDISGVSNSFPEPNVVSSKVFKFRSDSRKEHQFNQLTNTYSDTFVDQSLFRKNSELTGSISSNCLEELSREEPRRELSYKRGHNDTIMDNKIFITNTRRVAPKLSSLSVPQQTTVCHQLSSSTSQSSFLEFKPKDQQNKEIENLWELTRNEGCAAKCREKYWKSRYFGNNLSSDGKEDRRTSPNVTKKGIKSSDVASEGSASLNSLNEKLGIYLDIQSWRWKGAVCSVCISKSHISKHCPNRPCSHCGSLQHTHSECPLRNCFCQLCGNSGHSGVPEITCSQRAVERSIFKVDKGQTEDIITCICCGHKGHLYCDFFRKKGGKWGRATIRTSTFNSCFVCGRKGHIGSGCKESRANKIVQRKRLELKRTKFTQAALQQSLTHKVWSSSEDEAESASGVYNISEADLKDFNLRERVQIDQSIISKVLKMDPPQSISDLLDSGVPTVASEDATIISLSKGKPGSSKFSKQPSASSPAPSSIDSVLESSIAGIANSATLGSKEHTNRLSKLTRKQTKILRREDLKQRKATKRKKKKKRTSASSVGSDPFRISSCPHLMSS